MYWVKTSFKTFQRSVLYAVYGDQKVAQLVANSMESSQCADYMRHHMDGLYHAEWRINHRSSIKARPQEELKMPLGQIRHPDGRVTKEISAKLATSLDRIDEHTFLTSDFRSLFGIKDPTGEDRDTYILSKDIIDEAKNIIDGKLDPDKSDTGVNNLLQYSNHLTYNLFHPIIKHSIIHRLSNFMEVNNATCVHYDEHPYYVAKTATLVTETESQCIGEGSCATAQDQP